MVGMLHFLLTVIAAWVVWKIVRYEIGRRRAVLEQYNRFRPAAGVEMRGERLEQWRRDQEQRTRERQADQATRIAAQKERIEQLLKSTPWHKRAAARRHLEQKIALGYDI